MHSQAHSLRLPLLSIGHGNGWKVDLRKGCCSFSLALYVERGYCFKLILREGTQLVLIHVNFGSCKVCGILLKRATFDTYDPKVNNKNTYYHCNSQYFSPRANTKMMLHAAMERVTVLEVRNRLYYWI